MQAEIRFDEGEVPLDELAGRLSEVTNVLPAKLQAAGEQIALRFEETAKTEVPTETGTLRSSIATVVDTVGATLLQVKVGSPEDYAAPVEFGSEPHFPPVDELRGWARRVLGDESAAFPVARSIAQSGTDAQPFIRPALEENLEFVLDTINEAVEAAFAEVGLA